MLELGDREVEDETELPEEAGGPAEAFVDPLLSAAGVVEPGAQPRCLCLQKWG